MKPIAALSIACLLTAGQAESPTTGTLKGVVKFQGEAPKPRTIQTRDGNEIAARDLIIDAEGRIANVAVMIEGAKTTKWASGPVEMTIQDEGFEPRVLFVSPGANVTIRNGLKKNENVHGIGAKNPEFNNNLPPEGLFAKTFEAEERVLLKSDGRPWKVAHVFVTTHPLHAVTGREGRFEISKIPAGKYQLKLWHENLGERSVDVEVREGETRDLGALLINPPGK